jgi:hypothetical protein
MIQTSADAALIGFVITIRGIVCSDIEHNITKFKNIKRIFRNLRFSFLRAFSLHSAILLKTPEFPDPYAVRSPIGIVENTDENYLTLNYADCSNHCQDRSSCSDIYKIRADWLMGK